MKKFRELMQQQLNAMIATGKLFRANIPGEAIWDLYLSSFDVDPIFRDPESTVHNCTLCNNFIRRYGNIVALDENFKLMTLFDVAADTEYAPVAKAMDSLVRKQKIVEVFFETYEELNALPYGKVRKGASHYQLGIESNVKRYTPEEAAAYAGNTVEADEVRTFEHMSLSMPAAFVLRNKGSIATILHNYRDDKEVFKKGMEISLDTFKLVIDLIKQGSLLDGEAHLKKIEEILPLREAFEDVPSRQRDNWCWDASYNLPYAKFKNHLIGVLCTELSEGMEINRACENWNKRVDPINYMKATAPITKQQIKEAKIFVEDNGYESAFKRRPATIADIQTSEILHINGGDGKTADISVFDKVKSTSTRHKRSEFDGVEEIPIAKFMKDILPECTSIEVFLKNDQEDNMVNLTTADTEDSKHIFKWPNNYSWTYNKNLAGKSMIKAAVKGRGGATDGIVNIRMAFPGTDKDYDLHCQEPNNGTHIYYSNKRTEQASSGMLDLDAQGIDGWFPPKERVENINYTDLNRMPVGDYLVEVNDYSGSKFPADCFIEVEIGGEMSSFVIEAKATQVNRVSVCTIRLTKEGEFTIIPSSNIKLISSNSISKEFYSLETNHFHKVNLMCLSPNHWGDSSIGNKHYLFMLEGAQAKKSFRSFHNENLKSDLVSHRKVMEVLANTTMVESTPKELSGLGFNATVRDEVILRLKGSHKRVVKIKF